MAQAALDTQKLEVLPPFEAEQDVASIPSSILSSLIDHQPATPAAISVLQSLPLRSNTAVYCLNGRYSVGDASFKDGDVAHQTTRIDVVQALHWNCKLTSWAVEELMSFSPFFGLDDLMLGYRFFRLLKRHEAKRLALLKEFMLISAAQKLMKKRGERKMVVLNTYMLLQSMDLPPSIPIIKRNSKQKAMQEYAAKYSGEFTYFKGCVQLRNGSSRKKEAMSKYIEDYQLKHCDSMLEPNPSNTGSPLKRKTSQVLTPQKRPKPHQPLGLKANTVIDCDRDEQNLATMKARFVREQSASRADEVRWRGNEHLR